MTVTVVLIPLGLMASGVESMDWRGGTAVVVLFGSGVGLLMAYVGVEVHRMAGAPTSERGP